MRAVNARAACARLRGARAEDLFRTAPFCSTSQRRISVIQSTRRAQVYVGGGTWSQLTMNTALRGTATAELANLRHRGAGSPPVTEGTRGRRCSRGRSRDRSSKANAHYGGQFESSWVGLSVLNCELFAGKSRCRPEEPNRPVGPTEPNPRLSYTFALSVLSCSGVNRHRTT